MVCGCYCEFRLRVFTRRKTRCSRSGSYVCMIYGVFANWSTRNETLDFLVGLVTQLRRIFASAKSERDRLPGIMLLQNARALISVKRTFIYCASLLLLSSCFHAYFRSWLRMHSFNTPSTTRWCRVCKANKINRLRFTFARDVVYLIEVLSHKKKKRSVYTPKGINDGEQCLSVSLN